MVITNDIKYIGVNDMEIDLFEGQYTVPNGISYNSYVIFDKKIAVMDTVDAYYGETWLSNLEEALGGREPDYLIIHHMEPDHSANIKKFANAYPSAKIVASQKAFSMMACFFGTDFSERRIMVGEGSVLSLGKHQLVFVTAPMVHWPEVVLSYDSYEKVLFSADAFGKFGAIGTDEPWVDEARRYYIGIVGKYGAQVQALLKKAVVLDIQKICPLHGPVISENIEYHMSLYNTWSSYKPEEDGVAIAYASIYGNTAKAAKILAEKLEEAGIRVEIFDLARCDISEPVAAAFRFTKLVLASSTYNGGVFPPMKRFTDALLERNFGSRKIALIENGSWAPMAAKQMRAQLEGAKNLSFLETTVKITSAVDGANLAELAALTEELSK